MGMILGMTMAASIAGRVFDATQGQWSFANRQRSWSVAARFDEQSAVPEGFIVGTATVPPIDALGRGAVQGNGVSSASVIARSVSRGEVDGGGSSSAIIDGRYGQKQTVSGSGNSSATVIPRSISRVLIFGDVGAHPNTNEIADAVANRVASTGGLTLTQAQQLQRMLDLMEADEVHTSAQILRKTKGTETILQRKSVSGSGRSTTLTIVEQP
jgi:hypothetical protein